jgi:hypothetical protein
VPVVICDGSAKLVVLVMLALVVTPFVVALVWLPVMS